MATCAFTLKKKTPMGTRLRLEIVSKINLYMSISNDVAIFCLNYLQLYEKREQSECTEGMMLSCGYQLV